MTKLILLCAAVCWAQTVAPGPQVFTFFSAVDDSDQPYAMYVPATYRPTERWPLVISLHGAGSNHRLNLRRVFGQGNRIGESDAQATRNFPPMRSVQFLVASPLARGTMGYQNLAERDVYDVLAEVQRRFAVDEDRVYLTGLAMGGGGTLWLGLTRPDVWAALAAVCPAAPDGTEELAGNALAVPVKLFQGELDPLVPAASTRAWHKRLIESGVNAEYVEYPGVRHNAWDSAYRNASIFEWFGRYRRVRAPSRVQFSTRSYRHGSAYWLRFDRITPGVLASADARVERDHLTVTTRNLQSFTANLTGFHVAVTAAVIDGKAVRIRPARREAISFRRTGAGWALGRSEPTAVEKRRGYEGPIADAISSRHLYVYGAGMREMAAQAAEWSTPRSRLMLSFRVIEDKQVKDDDLRDSDVVLFGTKETNRLIARYADRLPMHLNPGAADYGLVYVYPVEGRYALISSGLPWWTRIDQANRPGLPFLAAPYRALASFGDYLIFRGGLDNVIAEGRFDDRWRLPADVAGRLRETGAFEVRSQ